MPHTVDFISQFSRALEGYDPPLTKYQVLAGSGITTPAAAFLLDTEFPETGNQYIFARFQSFFNNLKQ